MTTDESKHTPAAADDDRAMAEGSDMDDQCYALSDNDDGYADPCCEVFCCCC